MSPRTMKAPAIVAALALSGMLLGSTAANALTVNGITYTLTEADTGSAFTDQFTLTITGINGASDDEGGRSGVNAIAFTQPTGFVSATMINPASGFVTVEGGLNSSGCDGSGNFYCFDNTAIPPTPTTAFAADSSLTFVFNVTTTTGDFSNYTPSFKIDWVGDKNNYNLVSLPLPITGGNTPVPEPASLALLGSALSLAGFVAARRRRS